METNTKKIMKTLVLVLALATATATEGMAQKAISEKVNSTEKVSSFSVEDLGKLRFKLALENPLNQKAKILLVDNENNIVFKDYSAGNTQYVKAFDLTNLLDGKYTFIVELGSEKLTKELVIKTQTFRGVSLASNRK